MNEKIQNIIYDRVFELLKKRSGDKWSITELCAELSVSRDTLYRYVKNKENLIREVMRFKFEAHARRINEILDNEKSHTIGLSATIDALSDMIDDFEGIEIRSYPELMKENENHISQILRTIAQYLEDGIKAGNLKDIEDPRLLTRIIHRCVVEILSEKENKKEKIRRFLDIILHGIAKT